MEQLIHDILKTIDHAINKFQGDIPEMQKLVYEELQPLIKSFKIKDGKLLNDVGNLKLIGNIKNKLEKIILSDRYKNYVKEFVESFSSVSRLQINYFKQFNDKFKPKKTLPFIQQLAIESTITSLLGQGMQSSVVNPIQTILNQNITTGGSYSKFQEQIRNHILTNEYGEGFLERYTKQLTTDALHQYNAQYHEAIAQDLQFNWGRYVGSNITTSRQFCIFLTEKQWVHRSELSNIIKGEIDQQKVKLSNSTGLPLGMIPGTDADNFKIRRGGYNCGHQFFWVPDSSVPEKIKSAFQHNKDGFSTSPMPADILASSKKIQKIKENNKKVIKEFSEKGIPFYEDIAAHWDPDITLGSINRGCSHYAPFDNKININTDTDRLENKFYKQKIMIHEGAHAMHFNKKIVTYDQTDKDFDTFFTKAKSLIKGKAYQMEKDLTGILIKNFGDQTVSEQVMIYLDTLGGLTKGRYGGGHSVKYYRNGNMGKMEVFAHAITLAKMDNDYSNQSDTIKELTELMKAYGLKILQGK